PTEPLAATELPTNKLAIKNTVIRTRPTSTPKSNASRSPSISRLSERAFAVSNTVPATATTIDTGNSASLVLERSPSNQNVNDRIRVTSIIVVTKTITDDRKVVTITPPKNNLSGVPPAPPRAQSNTTQDE